jgi:hypothetical protein
MDLSDNRNHGIDWENNLIFLSFVPSFVSLETVCAQITESSQRHQAYEVTKKYHSE